MDVHLWLHGANLELQPLPFQMAFNELVDSIRAHLTVVGRYAQSELPKLFSNIDWVVVPSIWWENSPLVIQEAFQYRRPVICSDIGGMAEKVDNEINGLHFRANDPQSLAETIRRAVSTPGLWQQLQDGITPVYTMKEPMGSLTNLYNSLLSGRA